MYNLTFSPKLNILRKFRKIISFTLFTSHLNRHSSKLDLTYHIGLLQNAEMRKRLFSDWTMVLFVDTTSEKVFPKLYEKYISALNNKYPEVVVIRVSLHDNHGRDPALKFAKQTSKNNSVNFQFVKTLYRFFPAKYPVTLISRDLDARLCVREAVAIDMWTHSTFEFCRFFDNPGHANPFLAGLWGVKPSCHTESFQDVIDAGVCRMGASAISNVINKFLSFLTEKNIKRGYGIDELFLGQMDQRIRKDYYQSVLTFGKGTYYTGLNHQYTLNTGYKSLKIGIPMFCHIPATKPMVTNAPSEKETLLFDVYFVGEDLKIANNCSSDVKQWIFELTMNNNDKPFNLKKAQKMLGKEKANTIFRDLEKMSLAKFLKKHHFDKRVLPCFWYTFNNAINRDVSFLDMFRTFAPNDYEIRVLEAATAKAFASHPELWEIMITHLSNEQRDKLVKQLVDYFVGSLRTVKIKKTNITPLLKIIDREVVLHSKVFQQHQKNFKIIEEFWSGLMYYYPPTALETLNLSFE